MTRRQAKACLAAMAYACHYGSTKRSRINWCLRQAMTIDVLEADRIIQVAINSGILEETGTKRTDSWLAMVPAAVRGAFLAKGRKGRR
jgi:hypothetical protein